MSRMQRQRRMRRNKGGPHRILFLGFGLLLTAIAIGAISAVAWVVNVANSAPPLDANKPIQLGATSRVYAADGKTRLGFIQANDLRTPIAQAEIPHQPAQRDRRDRGPALLQAQGRRLRGHRPRRGEEPRVPQRASRAARR